MKSFDQLRNAVIFTAFSMVLPAYAAGESSYPPVSITDTLGFNEVKQVLMNPAGSTVAFVARRAVLGTKKNEDTVMTVPVGGGPTRVLCRGEKVNLKSWGKAGRQIFATVLSDDGHTHVIKIEAESGHEETVWESKSAVEVAAVSPDGRVCVVVVKVPYDYAGDEARDDGRVFDYGKDQFATLYLHASTSSVDVLVIDTTSKQVRRVIRLPFEGVDHPARNYVERIVIAPDNSMAALTLARAGDPKLGGSPTNFDIGVLDLKNGHWGLALENSIWTEAGATWLGNSERLFFFSRDEGKIFNSTTHLVTNLSWAKLPSDTWVSECSYNSESDTISLQGKDRVYRIRLTDQKIESEEETLAAPNYSADFKVSAFVSESSEMRPEVATRDRRTGSVNRLTNLNPLFDQRTLGRVEKLTVTNSFGTKATGYLVYPVGYVQGKRYPLLIASYGFTGKFILTAEWHTTFPTQVLAGQGYAVLLLNLPTGLKSAQQLAGDPVKAREHEGWQVMSTFESAVKLLDDRGIADPAKLGLYGWSHGGFVVQFMLAHSKLPINAACMGEGSDYNAAEFWFWGSKAWADIFTNTYGGPLTAKTAAAYLEFAPSLNVDHVHTPLLIEYARVHGANMAAEFYVPMRELGIPAELVIYDNEEHNFVRPTTRAASMKRKIDWFNYWMLGKEDSDPAKAAQYERWHAMKQVWEDATSSRNASH